MLKVILQLIDEHDMSDVDIANADETAMYFEMTSKIIFQKRGAQSVPVKTGGGDRLRCTVMLGITAAGGKMKPYIIFKGKAPANFAKKPRSNSIWAKVCQLIDEGKISKKVVVGVNEKAWMTTRDYNRWITECFRFRPGRPSSANHPNILIVDNFGPHKDPNINVRLLHDFNTYVVLVPPGCTPKFQPLDVLLMRVFKNHLRVLYASWVRENPVPAGEERPKPGLDLVCKWIEEAWDRVPTPLVKKSFQSAKCYGVTDEERKAAEEVEEQEEYIASTLLLPKDKYDELVEKDQLGGSLEVITRTLHYHPAVAVDDPDASSEGDDATSEEEKAAQPKVIVRKRKPAAKKKKAPARKRKLSGRQRLHQARRVTFFELINLEDSSSDSDSGESSPALVSRPAVAAPKAPSSTRPTNRAARSRLAQMETAELQWALEDSKRIACGEPSTDYVNPTSEQSDKPKPRRGRAVTLLCKAPKGCDNPGSEAFKCSTCKRPVHHLCYIQWARENGLEYDDGKVYCEKDAPGLKSA